MKATAKARIAYTGAALDGGNMDVRELAPALISFAGLVDSANNAIGGKQKIRVMLNQDSLRRGSFDITFLLDADVLEQAKLFIGWASDTSLDELVDALGWETVGKLADVRTLAGGGIFWLIKKIRDRKIKTIERDENKKLAEITLNDGEKITATENTLKLYLDVECRVNVEKILEPLKHDGVDGFELRSPDEADNAEPILTVDESERQYFSAPVVAPFGDEQPNVLPDQEILAKLVTVNFDKGKWRLNDGTNTFWVSMCDDDFNKRVEQREINFAAGDMLKIRYHIEQSIKAGNLTSEYIVTKVLDIRRKPRQINLAFDENER